MVETRAARIAPSDPESSRNGGHEHEQRREREERLEPLLDREPGEHVDRAREHEDRERLDHDAAQDRQPVTRTRDTQRADAERDAERSRSPA